MIEMIDLYTASTSNGKRVSIMLEETGLPYVAHAVDLSQGEQRRTEYLELNPMGAIPVIVDTDGPLGKPLKLAQSAAILIYLAEKSGSLLPSEPLSRAQVLEWLFINATDIAPARFHAFLHERRGHDQAAKQLRERVADFYGIFDKHLTQHAYLGGQDYSIADVAAYPWVASMKHPRVEALSHLQRWMERVGTRAAVQRGMRVPQS
jgi:GSH-dependent disulfide-bond oxidoreductase